MGSLMFSRILIVMLLTTTIFMIYLISHKTMYLNVFGLSYSRVIDDVDESDESNEPDESNGWI